MKELIEIINTVLKNADKEPVETFNDNLHLRDDLGFDSFNLAELTVRIEEKFGIDVFENGLINTVGELKKELNIL
jgi:acyl carrier protein